MATISQRQVVTLIDSGTTHNFMSDKAANRLNLKLTQTKPFTVRVADGNPLRCTNKYQGVAIELGSVVFNIDLYRLPLTGT